MLIRYCWPIVWAGILTLSLLGWGRLLRTVLRVPESYPPGVDISLGLVFAVVVGGVLNVFSLASRPAVLGFALVGALLGVRHAGRLMHWIPNALPTGVFTAERRARVAYLALLSAVLGVMLLATVRAGASPGNSTVARFNPHDDFHAYLVFPERMLQTGNIGADPFNERRLSTGLGGQSFLLGLMRAGAPFESLHLLEPGIGTVAALLTLLALCSVLSLGWSGAFALLALAAVYPLRIANASSFTTGVALLLCLVVLLVQWPSERQRSGLLVLTGLTMGAACALKTTFLAPVVVFIVLFFFFRVWFDRQRLLVIREAVGVGLLALGVLVPWMVSLYRSSGTMLFPILGSGTSSAPSHTRCSRRCPRPASSPIP